MFMLANSLCLGVGPFSSSSGCGFPSLTATLMASLAEVDELKSELESRSFSSGRQSCVPG